MTWHELYNGPPVALISENMARELWRDPRAAVGKRIRASLNQEWREIIGVVADIRDDGPSRSAPTIVYWPLLQKAVNGSFTVPRNVDFMIRSPRAGSAQFIRDLQRALQSVNASLPLANVRTLGTIYEKSMARVSFVLILLAVAGAIAFILGVVGIYGVISYSVAQRRKEIGIRIALGSCARAVITMYVRQGLVLAGAGAVIGLLASVAATRLMQSILYGVSPVDPATYGVMLVLIAMAALLASWLPARKAASVDPIETLRAE